MIVMEIGACRYNPVRDCTPVSQTGFIDLCSAFVNNTIPPSIGVSETEYNGMDDPSMILGKPSDVFEAIEMESHINSYRPDSDSANG